MPSGLNFLETIWTMPMGPSRDARIVEAVLSDASAAATDLHQKLVAIPLAGGRGEFYATKDYLGTGDPPVRLPMSGPSAQKVADALNFVLPTSRMVELVYQAAPVKLPFRGLVNKPEDTRHMTSTPWIERHDRLIEQDRHGRAGLVAGHKKDVILSNKLVAKPRSVAIFGGWFLHPTRLVQPPSTRHEATYSDYSHGVRGVAPMMMLDGASVRVLDVLRGKDHALLSSEGPLQVVRYPGDGGGPFPAPPGPRAPSPAPGEPFPAPPARLLRRGSQGPEVAVWRVFLGFEGGDVFDAETEERTRVFQRSAGIGVDGVVGPDTRRAAAKGGGGGGPGPSSAPPVPSSPAPSSTPSSDRWARGVLASAWAVVHPGHRPNLAELQITQAIGRMEGGYGRAWKEGRGAGSRNWGAIQGSGSAGSFQTTDTHADGTRYTGTFKAYTTDEEAAADVVRMVTTVRPHVRHVLPSGDAIAVAEQMRRHVRKGEPFWSGGPLADREFYGYFEAPAASYAKGIARNAGAIASTLGEAVAVHMGPVQGPPSGPPRGAPAPAGRGGGVEALLASRRGRAPSPSLPTRARGPSGVDALLRSRGFRPGSGGLTAASGAGYYYPGGDELDRLAYERDHPDGVWLENPYPSGESIDATTGSVSRAEVERLNRAINEMNGDVSLAAARTQRGTPAWDLMLEFYGRWQRFMGDWNVWYQFHVDRYWYFLDVLIEYEVEAEFSAFVTRYAQLIEYWRKMGHTTTAPDPQTIPDDPPKPRSKDDDDDDGLFSFGWAKVALGAAAVLGVGYLLGKVAT